MRLLLRNCNHRASTAIWALQGGEEGSVPPRPPSRRRRTSVHHDGMTGDKKRSRKKKEGSSLDEEGPVRAPLNRVKGTTDGVVEADARRVQDNIAGGKGGPEARDALGKVEKPALQDSLTPTSEAETWDHNGKGGVAVATSYPSAGRMFHLSVLVNAGDLLNTSEMTVMGASTGGTPSSSHPPDGVLVPSEGSKGAVDSLSVLKGMNAPINPNADQLLQLTAAEDDAQEGNTSYQGSQKEKPERGEGGEKLHTSGHEASSLSDYDRELTPAAAMPPSLSDGDLTPPPLATSPPAGPTSTFQYDVELTPGNTISSSQQQTSQESGNLGPAEGDETLLSSSAASSRQDEGPALPTPPYDSPSTSVQPSEDPEVVASPPLLSSPLGGSTSPQQYDSELVSRSPYQGNEKEGSAPWQRSNGKTTTDQGTAMGRNTELTARGGSNVEPINQVASSQQLTSPAAGPTPGVEYMLELGADSQSPPHPPNDAPAADGSDRATPAEGYVLELTPGAATPPPQAPEALPHQQLLTTSPEEPTSRVAYNLELTTAGAALSLKPGDRSGLGDQPSGREAASTSAAGQEPMPNAHMPAPGPEGETTSQQVHPKAQDIGAPSEYVPELGTAGSPPPLEDAPEPAVRPFPGNHQPPVSQSDYQTELTSQGAIAPPEPASTSGATQVPMGEGEATTSPAEYSSELTASPSAMSPEGSLLNTTAPSSYAQELSPQGSVPPPAPAKDDLGWHDLLPARADEPTSQQSYDSELTSVPDTSSDRSTSPDVYEREVSDSAAVPTARTTGAAPTNLQLNHEVDQPTSSSEHPADLSSHPSSTTDPVPLSNVETQLQFPASVTEPPALEGLQSDEDIATLPPSSLGLPHVPVCEMAVQGQAGEAGAYQDKGEQQEAGSRSHLGVLGPRTEDATEGSPQQKPEGPQAREGPVEGSVSPEDDKSEDHEVSLRDLVGRQLESGAAEGLEAILKAVQRRLRQQVTHQRQCLESLHGEVIALRDRMMSLAQGDHVPQKADQGGETLSEAGQQLDQMVNKVEELQNDLKRTVDLTEDLNEALVEVRYKVTSGASYKYDASEPHDAEPMGPGARTLRSAKAVATWPFKGIQVTQKTSWTPVVADTGSGGSDMDSTDGGGRGGGQSSGGGGGGDESSPSDPKFPKQWLLVAMVAALGLGTALYLNLTRVDASSHDLSDAVRDKQRPPHSSDKHQPDGEGAWVKKLAGDAGQGVAELGGKVGAATARLSEKLVDAQSTSREEDDKQMMARVILGAALGLVLIVTSIPRGPGKGPDKKASSQRGSHTPRYTYDLNPFGAE